MTDLFPSAPEQGQLLDTSQDNAAVRAFLAQRRSAGKMTLSAPGPDEDTLADLLRIAARVPDHRKLEPWRFITFTGDARAEFGTVLAEIATNTPEMAQSDRDMAAGLLLRAPCVVAVVSSPNTAHKTPVWEQELSVGAVCLTLVQAAQSSGFGACWLSEWIAFDARVDAALGLSTDERIAGYIYIGATDMQAPERPRPDIAAKVTAWAGTRA